MNESVEVNEVEVRPFSIEELSKIIEALEKERKAAQMVASDIAGQIDNARAEVERLEVKAEDMEEAAKKTSEKLTEYNRIMATLMAFKKEQEEIHEMLLGDAKEIMLQLKVEGGGIDKAGLDRLAQSLGIDISTGFVEPDKLE